MDLPVGAVVSDHEESSKVGREILLQNGSAVDAAIATAICNSVLVPQSAGIGGGTYMVIHDKASDETVYIDGRSSAPLAMTLEMYENLKDRDVDARTIGIPGALKAMKIAHEKYGRLPWSKLFQPAIKKLRDGFPLSESTDFAFYLDDNFGLKKYKPIDREKFPLLTSMFCSNGEEKRTGDTMYLPRLAETLEGIAEQGPDYIYNSHVTDTIVKELQQQGGVHSAADFEQYTPRFGPALSLDLGEFTLNTVPEASGGPILTFILNVLKGCAISPSDLDTVDSRAELYHKLIETIRFGLCMKKDQGDSHYHNIEKVIEHSTSDSYARSIRKKITSETHEAGYYCDGKPAYDPDIGTSHISVLGPDGVAVSITSTIFVYFGSRIVSQSTGIIWNNVLDIFSIDEQDVANVVAPGKRPRSSMAPVIITDKSGSVKMVAGAAGGARIITSLAQVLVKILWGKMPLVQAIEEKRFHIHLGILILERGFPEDIKQKLAAKGHDARGDPAPYMAVGQVIYIDQRGVIQGYADSRKRPGRACLVYKSEKDEVRSNENEQEFIAL